MCEAGFAGPACASEEEVLVAESRVAHTLPPSRVPAWVTPMAVTLSLLLVSAVVAAAYLYTVAERRKHKLLAGSQYARPSDQASLEDVEAKGKKSSSSSSSPERLTVLQLRNAKQRACSTDVEDDEEEQGFVNKDFTVDMGGDDDDDLENSI
jgi:hypothetical protein